MKKYFIYAAAAMTLAGCASDDYLGESNPTLTRQDNGAINFDGGAGAMTRAGNSEAAKKLDNKFWVYGTKHTGDDGEGLTDNADEIVYKNYVVLYTDGTDNNTVSNTAGWEYVGVTNSWKDYVKDAIKNDQTIKYWDYSAKNYTFYAVSAKAEDLEKGRILIEKITSVTGTDATVYDKGYKVTLKTVDNVEPDLDKLYFADRKVITKTNDAVHGNGDVYGGQVNFTFRNAGTKVRVAMYETIPGYSVKVDKFYYTTGENNEDNSTGAFMANVNNTPLTTGTGDGTTYTVTYVKEDGDSQNQPQIAIEETENTYITLGSHITETGKLSTTSQAPTYDKAEGKYTHFMPQPGNTSNLKLKIDYTLTSDDGSGEEIVVKGATAEIPAGYLKWKHRFAYTYIFKISANTNGSTGGDGDPAGLYPITFDATVVEAEDGSAEWITTVSEASITTFGVKDGKYVSGGSEYEAGTDVYATVLEGNDVITLTSGMGEENGNTKVYKITAADSEKIDEAQVAEWIGENQTDGKLEQYTTGSVAFVNEVPGEDGVNVTISAVRLAGIQAGRYAIEYTSATAWTGGTAGNYTKIYKVITVTGDTAQGGN